MATRFLPVRDIDLIERNAGLHERWPRPVVWAKVRWNWLLGLPHQVIRVDRLVVGPNPFLCAMAARGGLLRDERVLVVHRPARDPWPYDLILSEPIRALIQRLAGLDRLDGVAAAARGARDAALVGDLSGQVDPRALQVAATRTWFDDVFARLLSRAQVDSGGRLLRLDRGVSPAAAPIETAAGVMVRLEEGDTPSSPDPGSTALRRLADSAFAATLPSHSERLVPQHRSRGGPPILLTRRVILAGQAEGVVPASASPHIHRLGSAAAFPEDPEAMLAALVEGLIAALA